MSTTYVALLRGINVGKAKRIAMADLRALIAGLGFADVRTLLNSGNAVFRGDGEPAQIAADIEKAIVGTCGFSSRVTVLTGHNLQRIVDENPFADIATEPSRYLVAVLQDAADVTRLAPLLERDFSPERMAPGPRAVYLWCASGILESGMLDLIGKSFGDRATTRNWATIGKLLAMAKTL
jgi:uncharacterized protein (DUF1697 family)